MKNIKIVFHPKTFPTSLFNVFPILVIDFKRKNVQSQINLFKKHTIRPICIRGRPQNQAFFCSAVIVYQLLSLPTNRSIQLQCNTTNTRILLN